MTKQHAKRRYPARPPPPKATTAASSNGSIASGQEDALVIKINKLLDTELAGKDSVQVFSSKDVRPEDIMSIMQKLSLFNVNTAMRRKDSLKSIRECLTEVLDRVYPVGAAKFDADGFAEKLRSQGILARLFNQVAHRAQLHANDDILMQLLILMVGVQRNAGRHILLCDEDAVVDLARPCLCTNMARPSPPDAKDVARIRSMVSFTGIDAKKWPEQEMMAVIGVWILKNMCEATKTPHGEFTAKASNMIVRSDLLPPLIDLALGDTAKENHLLVEAAAGLLHYIVKSRAALDCDKITSDIIIRAVDKCIASFPRRIGLYYFDVVNYVTRGCAATAFLSNPANWATIKKLISFTQSHNLTGDMLIVCISSITRLIDRCDRAVLEEARTQTMEDGELVLVRVAKWFCKAYAPNTAKTGAPLKTLLGLLLSALCQQDPSNLEIVKNVIDTSMSASVSRAVDQLSAVTGRLNEVQREEWAAKKRPCMCSEERVETKEQATERDMLIQRLKYIGHNCFEE